MWSKINDFLFERGNAQWTFVAASAICGLSVLVTIIFIMIEGAM